MGLSAIALVGAPPVFGTLAHDAWERRLIGYRTSMQRVGATKAYFSPSGNDSTGDGSIGNPYLTVAKAQAVHDAWASNSGRLQLLFQAGGVWRGQGTLAISKSNVTDCSYGVGPKPLFTLAQPLTFVSYQNDGTSFLFSGSVGHEVAWVKMANTGSGDFVDKPLKRLTATGGGLNVGVFATAGSWYDDGAGNTYIHPYDTAVSSYNTDGRSWEFIASNSTSAITVSGADQVCVEDLRFEGYGCNKSNPENYGWAIFVTQSVTNEVLVVNCEAYYSSDHILGASGTAGGITTWVGCKTGGTSPTPSNTGGTNLVSYATNGGQEVLFVDCVAAYGMLPSSDQDVTRLYGGGTSHYLAHTDGGSGHYSTLFLAIGCKNLPGQFQIGQSGGDNNPQPWSGDMANCRSFRVRDTFIARTPTQADPPPGSSVQVILPGDPGYANVITGYSRCSASIISSPSGFPASMGTIAGVLLCCDLSFDFSGLMPTAAATAIEYCNTGNFTGHLYRCNISMRSDYHGTYGIGVGADAAILAGCFIDGQGPTGATFAVGTTNDSSHLIGNAYSLNVSTGSTGYSGDATAITAVGNYAGHPVFSGPLYQSGPLLVEGYMIGADADLQPVGPLPSLGRSEPYTATGTDVVAAQVLAIQQQTTGLATSAQAVIIIAAVVNVAAQVWNFLQSSVSVGANMGNWLLSLIGVGTGAKTMVINVKDATTSANVVGASVTVTGSATATTDTSGNATVMLNAGTCNIGIVAANYLNPVPNSQVVNSSGNWVSSGTSTLALTIAPSTIVTPPATGQIWGVLQTLDMHGNPLAGVVVSFEMTDLPTGNTGNTWPTTAVTFTSDGSGNIAVEFPMGSVFTGETAGGAVVSFAVPTSGTQFNVPSILGRYT